jgi:hypothetical protein
MQMLALSLHDQTPAEGRDSQHAFQLWWWVWGCVRGRSPAFMGGREVGISSGSQPNVGEPG